MSKRNADPSLWGTGKPSIPELTRRATLLGGAGCAAAAALFAVAGCSSTPDMPEQVTAVDSSGYHLGAGDGIRLIVYGEDKLGGDYTVDGTGHMSLPLIGDVDAKGHTAPELEQEITDKLADGYIKNAKVSVQVTTFRPFYIIGEVNAPGHYAYVNGMTAITAVAMAGGFTYRASHDYILLTRTVGSERHEWRAPMTATVLPDDVIQVSERFF